MKTIPISLLVTLFIGFTTVAQENVSLFNGENLDGWYAFNAQSGVHTQASELFSAEEGLIRFYGKKAGYLMTNKSFKNFVLTAQFRWNTDTTFIKRSTTMNSGLMYLIPKNTEDELWPKGVQFQIKYGFTGDFIFLKNVTALVNGEQNTPGKSVVVSRSADAELPLGEWNTIKITHKDGHIRQELNGILVNAGDKCSVTEGRILLQYEGFPIDFKEIFVTPL